MMILDWLLEEIGTMRGEISRSVIRCLEREVLPVSCSTDILKHIFPLTMMKAALVGAAVVVAVLGMDCDGPVHHAFFGARVPYDELDFMDRVKEDRRFLRIIERVVTYPLDFMKPNTNMVTYVEVLDLLKNGNNGCAFLVNGGPGFNYTEVKFTSKRNQGLDMVIRIYVKRSYK